MGSTCDLNFSTKHPLGAGYLFSSLCDGIAPSAKVSLRCPLCGGSEQRAAEEDQVSPRSAWDGV